MTESNFIYALYGHVEAFLTQTFGEHFIFISVLLTTSVSIIYFIIINYAIVRMDARHFVRKTSTDPEGVLNENTHNLLNFNGSNVSFIGKTVFFLLKTLKILFGIVLVLLGLAMLVLPGQGLLTIVIGLSLLPFPGKDQLEQYLLSQQALRSSLNWIRKKANKEPFIFE